MMYLIYEEKMIPPLTPRAAPLTSSLQDNLLLLGIPLAATLDVHLTGVRTDIDRDNVGHVITVWLLWTGSRLASRHRRRWAHHTKQG